MALARAPRMGRMLTVALLAGSLTALVGAPGASATLPGTVPVLSSEVPAGGGTTVALRPSFDPAGRVDGRIGDWRGHPGGFGGSLVYSSAELVYQDHLFDPYGADDGRDARRLAVEDPATRLLPEAYRLDAAIGANLPGEFGVPTPTELSFSTRYGDLPFEGEADLSELRIGARGGALWLLARTTTMRAPARTALLVLLDTRPGSARHVVPWNSGIASTRADVALLLAGRRGWVADLTTGRLQPLPRGHVASDPHGYVNALEASVPRHLLGPLPNRLSVAAATGLIDPGGTRLKDLGLGANLANVAFRTHEPVRDWWDREQALALYHRTIDPFFARLDLHRLATGASERYVPGPGYHERIFRSSPRISAEHDQEGVLQHYGVYLPSGYRAGRRAPLQLWMHWRGGTANAAAALAPRIFKDLGEDQHTIVVSPRGRGTSRWYVGKGQVDFQEVWRDVHRSFSVDADRTYVAGHSMGGWASYLLTILYPDRFAAAFPASGPVTQGAWTGIDFSGCDELSDGGGETPCYISANGGDPRVEHTRRLLENELHVPLAIYQGAADELVPTTGVLRQVQRLVELGYRHRLYLFPAQEHYGPPIADQWTEGARYEHRFVRDPNPARVLYIRDMPFERAVERVQSDGVALRFSFDRAYWMSRLEPVDPRAGVARFDGRSLAIPERPHLVLPEAGGPASDGQAGPYAMTGLSWRDDPLHAAAPARNAFAATVSGARAVRLDLPRMRIDTSRCLTGTVSTAARLELALRARWTYPVLRVDGRPAALSVRRGVLSVGLPAGGHRLVACPGARRGPSARPPGRRRHAPRFTG